MDYKTLRKLFNRYKSLTAEIACLTIVNFLTQSFILILDIFREQSFNQF